MRLNVFQILEDESFAAFGAANTSGTADDPSGLRLASDRSVVATLAQLPLGEETSLPRGSFVSLLA